MIYVRRGQVKKYKLLLSKEKQIWLTGVKGIKAKESNRKRPSSLQRKNGNYKKKRRINNCLLVSAGGPMGFDRSLCRVYKLRAFCFGDPDAPGFF